MAGGGQSQGVRLMSGLKPKVRWADNGTTEVVPFPSLSPPKILGRKKPWNPTSRTERETWGTLRVHCCDSLRRLDSRGRPSPHCAGWAYGFWSGFGLARERT